MTLEQEAQAHLEARARAEYMRLVNLPENRNKFPRRTQFHGRASGEGMKRFLIFTVLFPPLAMVVYLVPHVPSVRDLLPIGFLLLLLGYAYAFAVIPAWLTAGVDWALSAKPLYLRLVATMPVAAIMAELIAHDLGQRGEVLTFTLMGAIPAAVCSWLSREKQDGRVQ
jgi:hypothetical protein